jgi:hypothetical protein
VTAWPKRVRPKGQRLRTQWSPGHRLFNGRQKSRGIVFTVNCSPRGLRHLYPFSPGEDDSGRVAYIQKILCMQRHRKDSEGPARQVRFKQGALDTVQLILQEDFWSEHVAFVQQNKNLLMDMIQDLWQTVNLLSCARSPPVEMTQNSRSLRHWPYTRATPLANWDFLVSNCPFIAESL